MNRLTGRVALGAIAIALIVGWAARFRIAAGLVDRRLAAAHVPAAYRITRIGPFLERLEDVRIGDPAAPDLVARRIEITVAYGLDGPAVRAIRAEGVRLGARIGPNGLSLGALDRLMPAAQGGGTKLPNLDVTLRDVRVALATPNGALTVVLDGDGNPARLFRGIARVAAPALRIASCRLDNVAAALRLTARGGAPTIAGPVAIGAVGCPDLALARGVAQLVGAADPSFRTVSAQVRLKGFGGAAGPARFAGLDARGTAGGQLGSLDVAADLAVHDLALPVASRAVAGFSAAGSATPVAAPVARAQVAVAALLARAEGKAAIGLAIRGETAEVRVHRLEVAGRDGARVTAMEGRGLRWSRAGWQADGIVKTGGGALPALTLTLRHDAPGAPLVAAGALPPYRVGDAMIAARPLRLRWDRTGLLFDTMLLIDGPLAGGAVQGLAVPVKGRVGSSGALAIGAGCQTIAVRALRLASFTFGPARADLCGRPLVARGVDGAIRIDATSGPIRLVGHTATGAAVLLATTGLHATARHFALDGLDASIGAPDRETRLAIPHLEGDFGAAGLGGRFEQASGRIANVPLDLGGTTGTWAFAGGALKVDGALRVADADAAPRFLPLDAEGATLRLDGNRIAARADLFEPKRHALVAKVDLDHDLGSGAGHATLVVPDLRFAPKGLQPEALTPLTLGVIANVAGTITGAGRIAWNAAGVTSSGDFATDRIDLAAAFGPVAGIRGTIRFTDLLGLVSAPDQVATIAEINPGVAVADGVVHYALPGGNRVRVQDATWPFAGGTLRLEPSLLDFGKEAERRLTFRIDRLDAAAFVQQLDFPNIAATGTFDGILPMIFDQNGGRIEGGSIVARAGGGSLAYVGELSNARLGTMGKLAFDALKAIRYSSLDIGLDGRLDGEMVSRVRFTGVREATPAQSLVTRLIRNLPFRFNIQIRAPFRGLVGSARAYVDPRLLLTQLPSAPPPAAVQPPASGDVR